MREEAPIACSRRRARKSGDGRQSFSASRISSGISIQRWRLTSCLISSMGKSGARSWGPMGWPVPGWSTGGAGVLRSAWTLYHRVGTSFSSRRILTRVLSDALPAMAASLAKRRFTIQRVAKDCQPSDHRHMTSLRLPRPDGTLERYTPRPFTPFPAPATPIRSRLGYAAVHVVADPLAPINPTLEVALDWETTLAYRRYVWSLGLAVAEAMDTSQRGMGFSWTTARELIRRTVAEAKATPGAVLASGAGTDHLEPGPRVTIADVEAAYEEQCDFIESVGGRLILMASRALAACAKSPDDYVKVYGRLLAQVREPVIIHWLGDMFDPALTGYWGSPDLDVATGTLLAIVEEHANKIDGVKISLLDQQREIAMRRRFPRGVRMYTGDDFDYPTTIRGDGERHSDALLGIFDVIAPAASAALHALDAGDVTRFDAVLAPTLPLSRHIFGAPTRFYKTGVVFMAYLNGHQSHFRMVGGLESARSVVHLAELFIRADEAGLLRDPERAVTRMRRVLAVAGIE